MEIDINYSFIYYTTNVNITGFYWKGFGLGIWYDTRIEDFTHARMRLKDIVWDGIYEEFPALRGNEFVYTESGELPVIDVNKM